MNRAVRGLHAALVTIAAFACSMAVAQGFPNRPLKLIVPDGPGTAPDIRARQLGAKLQEVLGQPVIVDNRPGASMVIGAEAAAKATPDGYTLFLGNVVTHSVNPWLVKTLPYRPDEDFIPVTMLSAGPLVLVANPSLEARTLAELIALAKAKPNQLNYGVPGQGSTAHILMEQIKARTGAQFEAVIYKSTAQYLQDLVGGHLHFSLNFWSVVGTNVRAGKLRALAVASNRRLDVAPEIPTFAEAGLPGIEAFAWQGIFLPAGTPRELVARLQSVIVRVVNMPEIRNPIIETGGEVGGNTPEEFAAFVRADRERWKKAVADANLQAN
jgi:tripartite-type tricarboxylate transporter receptor subunit TctC